MEVACLCVQRFIVSGKENGITSGKKLKKRKTERRLFAVWETVVGWCLFGLTTNKLGCVRIMVGERKSKSLGWLLPFYHYRSFSLMADCLLGPRRSS